MLVLARDATRFPETPKSQSFTSPLVLTRIFVGLTSALILSGRKNTSVDDVEIVFEVFETADGAACHPGEYLLIADANTRHDQFIQTSAIHLD